MLERLTLKEIKDWEEVPTGDSDKQIYLEEACNSYSDGTFPILDNTVKQAFISHLCKTWESASDQLRLYYLKFLRIILRDKVNSDLECFLPVFTILSDLAVLSSEKCDIIPPQSKLFLEAEKCSINLLYNSSKSRVVFQDNNSFEYLISRISAVSKVYGGAKEIYDGYEYLNEWSTGELDELLLYDLKIAFIVTALSQKLQKEGIDDTDKTIIFIDIVRYSIQKITGEDDNNKLLGEENISWKYANEALKTLMNLYHKANIFDMNIAQKCANECAIIIKSPSMDTETKQNAVNLLSVLPSTLPDLCPKLDPIKMPQPDKLTIIEMDGYDMRFVDALLNALETQIDNYEKDKSIIIEYIGTFLTVLNHLCTEHKICRRYCRLKIIPPLAAQQVERAPEVGKDFRNKIVRLMMGPSRCKELAAEFLFVLCKRSGSIDTIILNKLKITFSIGRMIKYCGFGHSAGLLANYGFLGQVTTTRRHASDSEDSETEEYKEVEDKINPVTGTITQPEQLEEWQRQIESMSEEQKEYEMMKLFDCIDKLMDHGVIAPGTIGPDGKPRKVEHVTELIKDVKEKEESDSD